MSFLKATDRIAVATMLSISTALPLAAFAAPAGLNYALSLAGDSRIITQDLAASIHRGMSEQDVLSRLGEPFRRERFERTRTVAWDYAARDGWGYGDELSVVFDDSGKVIEIVRVRRGE